MTQKLKSFFIALIAALAGLINSLVGAGGGVLLSIALPSLCKTDFPDRRDVYVNSQASMIPACALSCAIYATRGMLDTVGFSLFAIPAALGGIIGSLLLTKIKSGIVRVIFALLVIWSGIRMTWGIA